MARTSTGRDPNAGSGIGWGVHVWPPGVVMSLLVLELALLLLAFWARMRGMWFFTEQNFPSTYAQAFPLVAPWAGAVGGVTMGLFGVAKHWSTNGSVSTEWPAELRRTAQLEALRDRRAWNAWYLLRLPLGVVFGTVGALIVVFVSGTVAVTSGDDAGLDVSPRGMVLVGLLAFVIGYRQERFEDLITKLLDVALGPGRILTAPATGFSLGTATISFAADPGGSDSGRLAVTNEGTSLLVVPADAFAIDGADSGLFDVETLPGNLKSGGSGVVGLRYRPTAAGSHEATLTVTLAGSTQSVTLRGTAGPPAAG